MIHPPATLRRVEGSAIREDAGSPGTRTSVPVPGGSNPSTSPREATPDPYAVPDDEGLRWVGVASLHLPVDLILVETVLALFRSYVGKLGADLVVRAEGDEAETLALGYYARVGL